MTRVPTIIRLLALTALVLAAGCTKEECATCIDPCGEATLVIATEPDSLGVDWTMTRSDGFYFGARGPYTFTDIAPGEYRFIWRQSPYFTNTGPDTLDVTIAAGATDTIRGVFDVVTGPVRIETVGPPAGAPWVLEHILGMSWAGAGDTTLTDVAIGSCRVRWGDVDGWTTPSPDITFFSNAPDDTSVVTGVYVERFAFPDSEDRLVENFRNAYTGMDLEHYGALLHPDYVMLLQMSTQEEFPNVGPTLDVPEELDIAQKMFSGNAIVNSQDELVPGLAAIDLLLFSRLGEWATSPASDPIPNARFALFETRMLFSRGSASTLRVDGQVKMYVAGRDSTVDGVTRPYFELIGIQDLTGGFAAGKAVEDMSWGSVKALFR